MKVQFSNQLYSSNIHQKSVSTPVFKGNIDVETVKHYNIGIMPDGYIGKVKVFKKDGKETYLNLFKESSSLSEIYRLKDDSNKEVGSIELKLKKYESFNRFEQDEDPSHIFIEELRNYSKKDTPYYKKGLDEFSTIGTRLIQIAQRRSDEAGLQGNIELISKNESIGFYEKLGFKKYPFLSPFVNPNKMYLPANAKEPLSKLYGGL